MLRLNGPTDKEYSNLGDLEAVARLVNAVISRDPLSGGMALSGGPAITPFLRYGSRGVRVGERTGTRGVEITTKRVADRVTGEPTAYVGSLHSDPGSKFALDEVREIGRAFVEYLRQQGIGRIESSPIGGRTGQAVRDRLFRFSTGAKPDPNYPGHLGKYVLPD